MKCAWTSFLSTVPPGLRRDVDRLGRENLLELRLRLGKQPELRFPSQSVFLDSVATMGEIQYIINLASQYSPWSAATVAQGFVTAPGGHRIGICGEAVMQDGEVYSYRCISSVCMRVARDFPGLSANLCEIPGNLLIIGLPGCGKTSLLRDYIRACSDRQKKHICALDERIELFPKETDSFCFDPGLLTDVLSGGRKSWGILHALRNMNPDRIVLDEITSMEDCRGLIAACNCGIPITATAHAGSLSDLRRRPVYQALWENRIFEYVVQLQPDFVWKGERIDYAA